MKPIDVAATLHNKGSEKKRGLHEWASFCLIHYLKITKIIIRIELLFLKKINNEFYYKISFTIANCSHFVYRCCKKYGRKKL